MNQRYVGTFLAAALVVAACSGGGTATDEAGDGAVVEDTNPTPQQVTTTTTTVEQADAGASDFGVFGGVVVVGSDQYEFTLAGTALNCMQILARSFSGSGALIDADGNEVTLAEGGRAATIQLFVNAGGNESREAGESIILRDKRNDKLWMAGAEYEGSEILSVTIEGVVTRGTATFVDGNPTLSGGTPEPVPGTFEFTCGK